MSNTELGSTVLTLSVLLLSIHCLGYIFEKLRQPKLIGEILAGVLLGPYVLGKLNPVIFESIFGSTSNGPNKMDIILNFLYWVGLLFLMFLSGSESRKLVSQENRKHTAWLIGLGTSLRFFVVFALGFFVLPLDQIMGTIKNELSTLLVLSIAVSVTSIPVISRIFYDLGIIQTRFASLILGAAVLEDIILWGILTVATGLVVTNTNQNIVSSISMHILTTAVYMGLGLFVVPVLLRKIHKTRWNILNKASPVAYNLFILFIYTAIASKLDINLVFAAFLAGFGVIGGVGGPTRERFIDSLNSIAKVAFALFIPIYFAIVGYKLNLGRGFSLDLFLFFMIGSSALSILAVGLAAKFAGFAKLEIFNLAITMNARGGPGIVLASVAYDAGIINASFYTTLVLTAIFTSQIAGVWLRFVLNKGLSLLNDTSTAN